MIDPWSESQWVESLWVTGMGVMVAWACGLVGCFLILRRMAMVGDAVSHTILPGLVVAFLVSGSRGGWVMFVGAVVAGVFTIWLIELVHSRSLIKQDAAIGICFSALFAFGVLLVSRYADQVDLDQDCVLYGEIGQIYWSPTIAGIPEPALSMAIILVVVVLLLAAFYRPLVVSTFDPGLARSLGIRTSHYHYGLMTVLALVVVAAFKAVGAVMVVAMLIVPGSTAYLLAKRLPMMLGLTLVHGLLSSVMGFHLGQWLNCSTGAAMVTAGILLFFFAWLTTRIRVMVHRRASRQHYGMMHDDTAFTRAEDKESGPHPVRGTIR